MSRRVKTIVRTSVSARLGPNVRLAGVDEAGRGPLAGPVVVAAVILDPAQPIEGLDDSKRLSELQRETLYPCIIQRALAHCVIFVEPDEIDRINILQATMVGMSRALAGLAPFPQHALIDGNRLPEAMPCPAQAVVGGDASEACIGAASILAKVSRDRYMVDMDALHPGYGFARHKGYPVPEHMTALRLHGPCDLHRRSFAPVRQSLERPLFG